MRKKKSQRNFGKFFKGQKTVFCRATNMVSFGMCTVDYLYSSVTPYLISHCSGPKLENQLDVFMPSLDEIII